MISLRPRVPEGGKEKLSEHAPGMPNNKANSAGIHSGTKSQKLFLRTLFKRAPQSWQNSFFKLTFAPQCWQTSPLGGGIGGGNFDMESCEIEYSKHHLLLRLNAQAAHRQPIVTAKQNATIP